MNVKVAPRFLGEIKIVVTLIFVTACLSVAVFSNSAKSGDFLYPLDRALETLEDKLIYDDIANASLQGSFYEERGIELAQTQGTAYQTQAETNFAVSAARLEAAAEFLRNRLVENPKDESAQKVLDRLGRVATSH
jgi:hypothetical protein